MFCFRLLQVLSKSENLIKVFIFVNYLYLLNKATVNINRNTKVTKTELHCLAQQKIKLIRYEKNTGIFCLLSNLSEHPYFIKLLY